jgi:hypothetical protein
VSTTAAKRARSAHQPVGRWIRAEKRLAIYIRDNFACLYCGRSLKDAPAAEVTLDHLVARSEGGSNEATNLVTACRSCNSSRAAKAWRDFAPGGAHARIEAASAAPLNIALARAVIAGEASPLEDGGAAEALEGDRPIFICERQLIDNSCCGLIGHVRYA